MATRTMARSAVNPTIERLLRIKPGQEVIYYRGNYPADIARCLPKRAATEGSPPDMGAPTYLKVITEVSEAAKELARIGRVRLGQRSFIVGNSGKRGQVPQYEYFAVGISEKNLKEKCAT